MMLIEQAYSHFDELRQRHPHTAHTKMLIGRTLDFTSIQSWGISSFKANTVTLDIHTFEWGNLFKAKPHLLKHLIAHELGHIIAIKEDGCRSEEAADHYAALIMGEPFDNTLTDMTLCNSIQGAHHGK